MTTSITLGEFPDGHDWVDRLVLPHVPDVPASALISDALDFAVRTRAGAAALGRKGAGKTYGRRRAEEVFAAREARRAAADGLYRPQRVLTLTTVRAHRPEDVYVKLTQLLVNETPELRVRGRHKREDEIRADFVHTAHAEGVAALVIDEGELVRSVVLDVARDIMSEAEEVYRERAGQPAASASSGDPEVGPARDTDAPVDPSQEGSGAFGIGVVLVGTPGLRGRLGLSAEGGQRWARTLEVPPPDPAVVPDVYARWFPGFAPAVAAVGRAAWRAHIETAIVRDRPVPMRLLDRHAREYVRVMAAQAPGLRRLEDVPYNVDIFRATFDRLDGGNSRGEVG